MATSSPYPHPTLAKACTTLAAALEAFSAVHRQLANTPTDDPEYSSLALEAALAESAYEEARGVYEEARREQEEVGKAGGGGGEGV